MYCSYPSYKVTSTKTIQKLCAGMAAIGQRKPIYKLLHGYDYEPCNYFQTSV